MKIRKSNESDKIEIEKIHTRAFGKEKGPVIAGLVNGLFHDPTAEPRLSLVAEEDKKIIGHILFTKVVVTQTREPVSAQILAPLAILPEVQNRGIGTLLIKEGLDRLRQAGGELVFVLGHPNYYPRSGFIPAGALGYEAPYPIPMEHANAWMVQELCPGGIGRVKGRVVCSDVLNQPEHWRE
ncbi:GNAT family N-acetyltransferase [Desulfospira joergensenii]|uniref:GNAT family N-acetyltransferase n=1 Tax=Desulfospira joergensenii TaxID=53329 RepID=UPI0003B69FF0|nr:N-acetyltransferase [Desulfospira joergensenii]